MRISWLILTTAVLTLSACAREPETLPAEQTAQASAEVPAIVLTEPGVVGTVQTDPDSGLVVDEHWELVRAHCSACHSPALVTQNRGSRQTWLEMIRWMQETQGLWQFDAQTETAILDYLEMNYAPAALHRRAPLSTALMPPNPYADGE